MATEIVKVMDGKMILGLIAEVGQTEPTRRAGGGVLGSVDGERGTVQVSSSDATAENWVPFGKFSLPLARDHGKFDAPKIRR